MHGEVVPDPSACALCLDALATHEEVSRLPCAHVFHTACISGWLEYTTFRMRTCPLCRSNPLVSDEEAMDVAREAEEAARAARAAVVPRTSSFVLMV